MKIHKATFIALVIILFHFSVKAQTTDTTDNKEYRFTAIKELPHTPVKNQNSTQTCWSFSALSFFESEMLRQGKPEVDLSEMFIVNYCYRNKAQKYIRMQGRTNFGPGGIFYDVIDVISNWGIVPEMAYPGIKSAEGKFDHKEMDSDLKKMVDAEVEKKNGKLTSVWSEAFKHKVNFYLGEIPDSFQYDGREYTPETFMKNYCGINPDDYVQITSFSHHPFYKPFILEVPDNWIWSNFYNVPLDMMQRIIDKSLEKGFTVAWAADVTDKGFVTSRSGIAVVPDIVLNDSTNHEVPKNDSLYTNKGSSKFDPLKPFREKTISQELRQVDFDIQETTDDHGMHIIGLAKDQNGKIYYKVKNSWGNYNSNDGYFYASKPYMRYKTTSIMVNKNAIPDDIRRRLGL